MFRFQTSNFKFQIILNGLAGLFILTAAVFGQTENPPTPGAPRELKIPTVAEKKLANGLTVATVERKNVPLVTVEILIKSGARHEDMAKAGLANLTVQMLSKGTATRTASQIAEQIEQLGGTISSAAGWNNSVVQITVTNDKLEQAMAIFSDLILNPTFTQKEITLLKTQTLDGLDYNLKQPGFVANYVASRYSFNEHPAGGTPAGIKAVTRADIVKFKNENYLADNSVLIFTGDINASKANTLAQRFFEKMKKSKIAELALKSPPLTKRGEEPLIRKILVVDLPESGQASVNYARKLNEIDRYDKDLYYQANVLNSVLGGGYSSRLNQEIRIKRGLSYGAGSSFGWRIVGANFSTSTQTKDVSAAEVAQLVETELRKIVETDVFDGELAPRKLVLSGDFGRDMETTVGLADKVGELYGFGLPTSELNAFIPGVEGIKANQIKEFARSYLKGGNLIIVGEYKIFKDDLAKRFPSMPIEVIEASKLDLSRPNLQN
jgi:zinc protease